MSDVVLLALIYALAMVGQSLIKAWADRPACASAGDGYGDDEDDGDDWPGPSVAPSDPNGDQDSDSAGADPAILQYPSRKAA